MARAVEQRNQAEEISRLVVEAMPNAVVLADAGGRILLINGEGEKLFGYAREELIGQPVEMLVPERFRGAHPSHRAEYAADPEARPMGHGRDLFALRKDGAEVAVEIGLNPLQTTEGPCILSVIVDITERREAEVTAARLAAIVESSDDAIIGTDLDGVITNWNRGAERMFDYAANEALGKSFDLLISENRRGEGDRILAKMRLGESVQHFEMLRRTKDGRSLDVSVSISPIRNDSGEVVGTSRILRDITVPKEHEREIERMSRIYAALSQVNQAIVRVPTRDELFRRVCSVLVGHGGFRMAWVGWHDAESRRILPVAECGDRSGYLGRIEVYSDDRPKGRGPVGRAFREGRTFICNELLSDPSILPWREEIERRGFRASAVLPIRRGGVVCAVLSVYADEPFFFQDKEIDLLEEAADDLSFALDNLDREEARRQAELAVRRERDFSDAVLNSLPGVLFLYDENRKFLRWSQNFERVTGYDAGEIATMHPLDFFAGPDKELLAERIEEVFREGHASVEAGFVSKDGSVTPHYFTGIRTEIDDRACLVGVGIDITERLRAEEARLAIEGRYHTLFDYAPDGIVIADAGSTYLDANESMCRMLGYPHDELVGLHASDIVVASEVRHIDPALDAIKTKTPYHREWRFRRKDGSVFPAEVIATMMPDGNLLGMIRDITERKEAERALRELNDSLEHKVAERTAELESLNRELESFCYSVSHDLRAPLRGIAGFTQILAENHGEAMDETARNYFDRVLAATDRMGDLIDDLLKLSRVSREEFHLETVDLGAIARQIVGNLRLAAPERDVEVVIADDLLAQGDARLLRVMLENLLGNAWKFTSKTPAARIEFDVREENAGRVFFVRDNGAGFDMRYADKLFTPFQRLHGMREFPGTGIGLATVQRIVHRHGGRIWTEAEVDRGATFSFLLEAA